MCSTSEHFGSALKCLVSCLPTDWRVIECAMLRQKKDTNSLDGSQTIALDIWRYCNSELTLSYFSHGKDGILNALLYELITGIDGPGCVAYLRRWGLSGWLARSDSSTFQVCLQLASAFSSEYVDGIIQLAVTAASWIKDLRNPSLGIVSAFYCFWGPGQELTCLRVCILKSTLTGVGSKKQMLKGSP